MADWLDDVKSLDALCNMLASDYVDQHLYAALPQASRDSLSQFGRLFSSQICPRPRAAGPASHVRGGPPNLHRGHTRSGTRTGRDKPPPPSLNIPAANLWGAGYTLADA